MKKFHVYSSIDENFNKSQTLQSAVNFGMIALQSQKTIAGRGKLTLYKAHSTPKACFLCVTFAHHKNWRILFYLI